MSYINALFLQLMYTQIILKFVEWLKTFFFNISFYCTTSLITDYKYTYVTINGL